MDNSQMEGDEKYQDKGQTENVRREGLYMPRLSAAANGQIDQVPKAAADDEDKAMQLVIPAATALASAAVSRNNGMTETGLIFGPDWILVSVESSLPMRGVALETIR